MNPSPESSPRAGRSRRVAVLTALPLLALALALFAYSGLHTPADAGAQPGSAPAAGSLPSIPPAAAVTPTEIDRVPMPSAHDAELLAYRPHGG